MNAKITKGTYTSSSYANMINFGGVPIVYMDAYMISGSMVSGTNVIPRQIYWLPAGSHSMSLYCPTVISAVTFTYTATITLIEFNIVP